MKKWCPKTVFIYASGALAGYALLELLIYLIFPFWKAKSGDLALCVLVLTFACACLTGKKQFLMRSFCTAVLLMSPAFIGLLAKQPLPLPMQYRTIAFSLIISGAFFLLQSLLPLGKIRRIVSIFFYAIVFLVFLLPWGYFFASHSLLNATAVLAVFQTNPAEAKSYLLDFMPWQAWGVMAVLLSAYVFILRQWQPSLVCLRDSLKNRWGFMLVVFCILLTGYSLYRTRDNFYKHLAWESQRGLQAYRDFTLYRNARAAALKDNLAGISSGRDGVYILVIGESQNKMHMSAYGYDKETTPWLDQMKNDTHTVFFTDARSCHTHTVPVLSYALTAKNQYDQRDLAKSTTLIEAAKAAGYETVWLSNQVRYGAWDTPTSAIASEADEQEWLNTHVGETTETAVYDGALADHLAQIKPTDKMLIVIHLMGNHGSYADRYPKDFAVEQGATAEYDNSILYNDYVVQHLYDTAKQMPNFQGMVYFADHADDVDRNIGHDASRFTQDMTRIPFYMIFSDEYMSRNPGVLHELREHAQVRFTNDLIYNTMLAVMGIMVPDDYEDKNDLTSPDYDSDKARFRTLHGQKELD
ncbi:MAG: sulfatase-like hydrolase/transferase [Mitsuokella sp.]|uniref:phosphoethanolamine transferase n=1 Tax=Mitsuokella sp. TaxID=2049034 RepID=UPI003D7D80E7